MYTCAHKTQYFEAVSPIPYIYTYIFSFRHGKLYRYEVEKYDIDSVSSFITGWYKNVHGESIPLPKTPL